LDEYESLIRCSIVVGIGGCMGCMGCMG